MKQQSLASQAAFEKYGRKSRRELFLEEMERVVPWTELSALVEPHYAKAGNGRRPVGLAIMLRTYFLQQWFNLSDPDVEEALYESAALRRFVGVDLGVAPAPDETTICRFRHLLEKHDLGEEMLEAVNHHLAAKGIQIATGTIVDATIIHAPSSTKNKSGERDPEMHQTRKGKQWYFGLKAQNWFGTDPSATPCSGPNIVAGVQLPCAYGAELASTFGTAHVGTERAPGYRVVDSSMFKQFRTYKEQVIQFRIDAFNVGNIASYAAPGSTASTSSTFGQITSTLSPARQLQYSLKYEF
jgi:IS5 family transposase